MKKIISLTLVLMLVMAMAAPSLAAGTGTITINNFHPENIYSIYKMLDLSIGGDGTAYTYTVNPLWADFFKAGTGALDYVSINAAGAVSWNTAEDDDTKAAFAKLAMEYVVSKGLSPIKTSSVPSDYTIDGTALKFTGLDLGYYLVDSTMGVLCGLTTTNPNGVINAKNGVPTVDKQVKEDSTGNWGDNNTADIGQTVNFRVTINVHAGAQNFVLHDVMDAGLTFTGVSMVQHVRPGEFEHTTPDTMYTVKTTGLSDTCTFEVVFTQEFCDKMETNDKIIVYYEAILNENAVIHDGVNKNKAHLSFGDETKVHESNEDDSATKTFSVDIVKTDGYDKLLDGAKFKIYDHPTETTDHEVLFTIKEAVKYNSGVHAKFLTDSVGNPLWFDFNGNGTQDADEYVGKILSYRRAGAGDVACEIVVCDGMVKLLGLDNGTYYLEETQEPDGYNILTARQKFIVSDANLDAIISAGGVYSSGSGVQVVNNTGSRLPETGGLGTLLFTLVGGTTALGTGVVLVTKKRMSMIEDEE